VCYPSSPPCCARSVLGPIMLRDPYPLAVCLRLLHVRTSHELAGSPRASAIQPCQKLDAPARPRHPSSPSCLFIKPLFIKPLLIKPLLIKPLQLAIATKRPPERSHEYPMRDFPNEAGRAVLLGGSTWWHVSTVRMTVRTPLSPPHLLSHATECHTYSMRCVTR